MLKIFLVTVVIAGLLSLIMPLPVVRIVLLAGALIIVAVVKHNRRKNK